MATPKLYKEIDKTILEAIPNPSKEAYEIKIKIPEFTFLGVKEQPDFAGPLLRQHPSACHAIPRHAPPCRPSGFEAT